MSRLISQAEIDRITSAVDIVDVIGSRVTLKTVGRDKVGLCPFHNENTPSFTVTPAKQVYLCFGCGATGDALTFIREYEGRTFLEALGELADRAGMPMPKPSGGPTAVDALAPAMAYYQEQLKKDNPGAAACRAYLASRGITEETAERFGIGYAPGGGSALLRALPKQQAHLEKLGFIDRMEDGRTLRDRFRHRLVIPIRSAGGQVIGATARTLKDEKPKYLNSQVSEWFRKDKTLFGVDQFRRATGASTANRAKKAYVVEGPTDVITAHNAGESHVVGVLGRSVSAEQARTLLSLADQVVFTFDGDAAGKLAIKSTFETLLEATGEAGRARFKLMPEKEDPASLIRDHGLSAFYDTPERGFLETLVSFLPEGESDDALLAKAEAGINLLIKIHDPLLRDAALRAVAKETGISADALRDRLATRESAPAKQAAVRREPLPGQRQFSAPGMALWRALLEAPTLVGEIEWPSCLCDADEPALQALPAIAESLTEGGAKPDFASLTSALGGLGVSDFVKALYAMPAPGNPAAEARDALAVLTRKLTRVAVDRYISRVKAGEKLSNEERAHYVELVRQQSAQAMNP